VILPDEMDFVFTPVSTFFQLISEHNHE